jgi:hypothetical protein
MMAEYHFCWRCQIEVPLLNEEEWEEIIPLLWSAMDDRAVDDLNWYGAETGETYESLAAAIENNSAPAVLLKYKELTGFTETYIPAIWHHRRSNFGSECPKCGKLFRTLRARLCAECGYQIESDA